MVGILKRGVEHRESGREMSNKARRLVVPVMK